jgi:hypothetical protein
MPPTPGIVEDMAETDDRQVAVTAPKDPGRAGPPTPAGPTISDVRRIELEPAENGAIVARVFLKTKDLAMGMDGKTFAFPNVDALEPFLNDHFTAAAPDVAPEAAEGLGPEGPPLPLTPMGPPASPPMSPPPVPGRPGRLMS